MNLRSPLLDYLSHDDDDVSDDDDGDDGAVVDVIWQLVEPHCV